MYLIIILSWIYLFYSLVLIQLYYNVKWILIDSNCLMFNVYEILTTQWFLTPLHMMSFILFFVIMTGFKLFRYSSYSRFIYKSGALYCCTLDYNAFPSMYVPVFLLHGIAHLLFLPIFADYKSMPYYYMQHCSANCEIFSENYSITAQLLHHPSITSYRTHITSDQSD